MPYSPILLHHALAGTIGLLSGTAVHSALPPPIPLALYELAQRTRLCWQALC